jgi:ABC-type transport system involved in multi-copper enzyme maturation permease subunit
MKKLKNLAYIEWLKYKDYNLTKIGLGIFLALFCFALLYAKDIVPNVSPPFPSVETFFEFPTVWDYQGQVGNWLVCIFLGFMVVQMICMEFSTRTMRQAIINGYTKYDYFLGKAILVVVLSLFATFLYIITTLIFGFFHTQDLELGLILDTNWAIPRFFIMCLGYLSIAVFFSFLIRRSGLSLIAYFGYIFIFEFIIRMIHFYYFRSSLMLFYPSNIIEDTVPNPLYKLPNIFMNKEWNFEPLLNYTEAVVGSIIVIFILTYTSWKLIKHRDI